MPQELHILTHPEPSLRQPSVDIDLNRLSDADFKQLLLDMAMTVVKKDGAGLAAPQVGKNIRLIVIRHEEETFFLINPKITKKSWGKEVGEEGCLSVLDKQGEIIYAPVERYKKITCLYWDAKGRKQKIRAEKILARIIQHEIDHLDGILFIDRVKKDKKIKLAE
jgi:peptide deformylase